MLPSGLQLPQAVDAISFEKVLVVEGRDAFEFFKAALRHLGLLNAIEVRNIGGNTEWLKYLQTLIRTPGFNRVRALGVARDAEVDAANAFAAVRGGLSAAGLPAPTQPNNIATGKPSVSVFILPDCVRPGMLETLCLDAVAGDPASPCLDLYFDCLRDSGTALPANMAKARLHAFLASRQEPGLLLGQASHRGYWPWDNAAFGPLFQFLRAL